MELLAAIDILGGRVVRLHQGRYDAVTVYAEDPVAEARRFEQQGARALHVVDLDGARSGEPRNLEVVERIVRAVGVPVQVGGGIRTRETAERWLAGGARVVLGTAAVKSPALVRELCAGAPGRVIVALDAHGDEVAVEGWTERSGQTVGALAGEVEGWGAGAILFTCIARDGTREGPDVEATAALQGAVAIPVIASGGIGTLEHLRQLARAGVRSAVCGRALYAGAFTLTEALALLAAEAG